MEDEIHVPTKKLMPDEADKLAREYGGYVHPGLKAVVLPALVSHDYREQQLIDRIIAALEDPSVEFETIDQMIDELAKLWKLETLNDTEWAWRGASVKFTSRVICTLTRGTPPDRCAQLHNATMYQMRKPGNEPIRCAVCDHNEATRIEYGCPLCDHCSISIDGVGVLKQEVNRNGSRIVATTH